MRQFSASGMRHRQNVCQRQTAYANGETTLADALEGMKLRAVLGETQYFRLNRETGALDEDYPGLQPIILDELARRAKFTWRDSYAVVAETPVGGKTYTELLLWTVENYDVSVSWWMNSVKRHSLGISFPESWYDASIIMIGVKNEESGSKFETFSFLEPFTNSVWILIIFSIIASGLVYWILELIDDKSDREKLKNSPVESIYLSAAAFTGHFEFQPQTHASRLFTVSLAFWALLVAATYTANLASFLVVENTSAVQLNSLEDAVRIRAPICVHKSSQTDETISSTFPNAILIKKKTEGDMYGGLRNGDCLVIATNAGSWAYWEKEATVNEDCALEWVGRIFRIFPAGFATKSDSGTLCTSLIRDVLNLHMLQMKEDGFLEEAWNQYLARMATVDCTLEDTALDDDNEQQQLDIQNMAGVFVFHFGLSLVAIFLAAWKVLRRKYKKRRLPRKNRNGCGSDEQGSRQPTGSDGQDEKDNDYDDYDFDSSDQSEGESLGAQVRRLSMQHRKQNKALEDQIGDLASQMSRIATLLESKESDHGCGSQGSTE